MMNRRQFLLSMIVSGTGLISTDAFCYERFFIEKNEFNIGDAGSAGPMVRIVQISDLHLKRISWYHNSLIREVNDLKADMLLFTGDTIESNEGLPLLDKLMPMFDRRIRKLAIPGNWEHAMDVNLKELQDILRRNNGELLINASEPFTLNGKRLMITGIDDMMTGKADFTEAVQDISREENHIVMAHCPQYRDYIEKEIAFVNRKRPEDKKLKIDFVFSGHTHGGQVTLLGFAPFLPPGVGNYVKGWYKEHLPHLYVSKGVGTSVLPVRFGARAEIAIFNYRLA